eukprot:144931-Amphidinium_carterae.1
MATDSSTTKEKEEKTTMGRKVKVAKVAKEERKKGYQPQQQQHQFQGNCNVCGKWGHAASTCWYNNDPRAQCSNVQQSHQQQQVGATSAPSTTGHPQ